MGQCSLKRHGPFVAFYFYCKIMLCGLNYTYYSVQTVKRCFHVPFRGWKWDAVRALTLCTHRPRGVFETVVGVAKSPDGNAWSGDAVSREHKWTCSTTTCRVFIVFRNGMKSVFMCECDLHGWVCFFQGRYICYKNMVYMCCVHSIYDQTRDILLLENLYSQ